MKRLISLLLLFCIGLPLLAQQQRPAQTPKRDQKKKEVAEIDTIPLYNGTYVGVDLYGIGSKLLVNVRMYQKYEQGDRDISKAQLTTLLRICKALSCKLSDIVTDAETSELLAEYEK